MIYELLFQRKEKEYIISKFLTYSWQGWHPIYGNPKNPGRVGQHIESLFNIPTNTNPEADEVMFEFKSKYSKNPLYEDITLFSEKHVNVEPLPLLQLMCLPYIAIIDELGEILLFDKKKLVHHFNTKMPSLAFFQGKLGRYKQQEYFFLETLDIYYDTSFTRFLELIKNRVIKVKITSNKNSRLFCINKNNLKKLYKEHEEIKGHIAPHSINETGTPQNIRIIHTEDGPIQIEYAYSRKSRQWCTAKTSFDQ